MPRPICVLHPQQAIDEALVRVDHALRRAGRTGRVDDVRRALGPQRPRVVEPDRARGACASACRACPSRARARGADPGSRWRTSGRRQHHDGLRVGDHAGEPRLGVGRIERQIRGTRLERGQQRHHHVEGSRPGRCRRAASVPRRTRTSGGGPAGWRERSARRTEGRVLEYQRDRRWIARRLRLDQLRHRRLRATSRLRVVEGVEQRRRSAGARLSMRCSGRSAGARASVLRMLT